MSTAFASAPGRSAEGRVYAFVRAELEQAEQPKYPFNVNTADATDLQRVRGIGPTLARRIIEGRPYSALADLRKIRGVSARQVEAWGEFLVAE